VRQTPAPLLFVLSGVSQYVGAGIAVGLFDEVPAMSVGWARILLAAMILAVFGRPWHVQWTRRTLLVTALFGVVLAAMNLTFYAALEYLPLGNVVALEFFGPVVVASLTGRGVRERVAIALALGGVALLAGVTLTSGTDGALLGLVFAILAGALWGCYILLGQRVSGQSSGLGPLAIAMATGALVRGGGVGTAVLRVGHLRGDCRRCLRFVSRALWP
jgi:inner membrane transporter RhtA